MKRNDNTPADKHQGPPGRDGSGRWKPGTSGSPDRCWKPGESGNPSGRSLGPDFRACITAAKGTAVIEADLVAVYDRLVAEAKAGNTQAARLLLDRLCAPEPPPALLVAAAKREVTLEEMLAGTWRSRDITIVTGVPEALPKGVA